MQEAKTVVWFADEERTLAVLALADALKPSSAGAVARLHALGITVWMLTGDNAGSARETARKAGITRFRAGVLPHEKAGFVRLFRYLRVLIRSDEIPNFASGKNHCQ